MINRREIGFALLFSVPPGFGVLGFFHQITQDLLVAVVAGLAVTVILFLLITLIVVTGPDEDITLSED